MEVLGEFDVVKWLTGFVYDSLTQVLALKFGYANVQEMMKDSRKRFSLLENGILDQPSTRLLLVNVSVISVSIAQLH